LSFHYNIIYIYYFRLICLFILIQERNKLHFIRKLYRGPWSTMYRGPWSTMYCGPRSQNDVVLINETDRWIRVTHFLFIYTALSFHIYCTFFSTQLQFPFNTTAVTFWYNYSCILSNETVVISKSNCSCVERELQLCWKESVVYMKVSGANSSVCFINQNDVVLETAVHDIRTALYSARWLSFYDWVTSHLEILCSLTTRPFGAHHFLSSTKSFKIHYGMYFVMQLILCL